MHINCNSARIGISLNGLPEDRYLSGLIFKNVIIEAEESLISREVHDITFDNVEIIGITEFQMRHVVQLFAFNLHN